MIDRDFENKLKRKLSRLTPAERARLLIDKYFELEDPNEKVKGLFADWLLSPVNGNSKELVLQEKFHQLMNRTEK